VGDFNGDGKPDLASANASNTVSVLSGDGSGNFAITTLTVPGIPLGIAVGDFNGDGKLDLVTATYSYGAVTVILGNGSGGFGAQTSFSVGHQPVSVTVGEFNGDNKPDLVTANQNTSILSVMLNDGTGGFGTVSDVNTGGVAYSVAVGDFNGDGKPDLTTANRDAKTVSILLGTGTGNFGNLTTTSLVHYPNSPVVGDFDADGKLDLAVADAGSNVSVLLGTGNGSLGPEAVFSVDIGSVGAVAGDFNADGRVDLATANYNAKTVSVLLNCPSQADPIIVPALPNQVATVGSLFSYAVPAFTGTGPITYSASGLPAGLSFDAATHTISGMPTIVEAPTVTITAVNAAGQNTGQFTITVSAAPVNPGSFAITGVTLVSCQAISSTQRQLVFTPQYTGTNGQPINFEVANEMLPTTNPGPYTLNIYTDNPSITLKATQSGTAGEASFGYNWLSVCNGGVPPGNQPPVAPVIPNTSGMVGQVYSVLIPPFTDPEGLPLTYSITGLPPGLLVTSGGNIVGPPTMAGVYVITVTATDPGGLSASATYTLTILPAGGNPGSFAISGVSLVSCQEIAPGKHQLVFTPQYTGTNGQPISFEVVNEMLPTTNPGPYSLGMYIDNPSITLKATQSGTAGEASFSYNWHFVCATIGARQGVRPTAESALEVRVLGNPVENGALSVEVRGAGGQPVLMNLSDLRGQIIGSHEVGQAEGVEQHTFEVNQQPAGLYLLRVSTLTQMRTLKVLKR
jgi:hypothetical protein